MRWRKDSLACGVARPALVAAMLAAPMAPALALDPALATRTDARADANGLMLGVRRFLGLTRQGPMPLIPPHLMTVDGSAEASVLAFIEPQAVTRPARGPARPSHRAAAQPSPPPAPPSPPARPRPRPPLNADLSPAARPQAPEGKAFDETWPATANAGPGEGGSMPFVIPEAKPVTLDEETSKNTASVAEPALVPRTKRPATPAPAASSSVATSKAGDHPAERDRRLRAPSTDPEVGSLSGSTAVDPMPAGTPDLVVEPVAAASAATEPETGASASQSPNAKVAVRPDKQNETTDLQTKAASDAGAAVRAIEDASGPIGRNDNGASAAMSSGDAVTLASAGDSAAALASRVSSQKADGSIDTKPDHPAPTPAQRRAAAENEDPRPTDRAAVRSDPHPPSFATASTATVAVAETPLNTVEAEEPAAPRISAWNALEGALVANLIGVARADTSTDVEAAEPPASTLRSILPYGGVSAPDDAEVVDFIGPRRPPVLVASAAVPRKPVPSTVTPRSRPPRPAPSGPIAASEPELPSSAAGAMPSPATEPTTVAVSGQNPPSPVAADAPQIAATPGADDGIQVQGGNAGSTTASVDDRSAELVADLETAAEPELNPRPVISSEAEDPPGNEVAAAGAAPEPVSSDDASADGEASHRAEPSDETEVDPAAAADDGSEFDEEVEGATEDGEDGEAPVIATKEVDFTEPPRLRPVPRLMRTMSALQDDIAMGSTAALAAQRIISQRMSDALRQVEDDDFRDPFIARALVAYALTGGAPEDVRKAFERGAFAPPYDKLAAGALAFMEGRAADATRHFDEVDMAAVPPTLAGPLQLALAALAVDDDPDIALKHLDYARLAAPATLVEEAALRRSILIAAERDDHERFAESTDRYMRKFRGSIYAGNFRRRFTSALTRMTFLDQPGAFDQLQTILKPMTDAGRREVFLELSRTAVESGKSTAGTAAARIAMTGAEPGSLELTRGQLYAAAADVVNPEKTLSAIESLEAIPTANLEEGDVALRRAAISLGRSVIDIPPSTPPQVPGAPLPAEPITELEMAAGEAAEEPPDANRNAMPAPDTILPATATADTVADAPPPEETMPIEGRARDMLATIDELLRTSE